MQSITDTRQLNRGESYILTREDVVDVEVEENQQAICVPWFDASSGKAFKSVAEGVEEALAVVPGPNGIALACFKDGALEVPGLLNDTIVDVQSQEEKRGTKRTTQDSIIMFLRLLMCVCV